MSGPHPRVIESPLEEPHDYLRIEVEFNRNGSIRRFAAQYETWVEAAGAFLVVTRYDTAHSGPHQDFYNREGEQIDKQPLDFPTLEAAAEYAERDLRRFWRVYKERFLGGRQ